MSVYPTESQGRVQDFSFFNIFNSSRYCRNQSQYRFVFARPNNKVMTAALTRSYEKTVQFCVGRRTEQLKVIDSGGEVLGERVTPLHQPRASDAGGMQGI